MARTDRARVALFALAGVGVGVGGTLIAGRLRPPDAPAAVPAPLPPPVATLAQAPGELSPSAGKLRALEARLARLEAQERSREVGAAPPEARAVDVREEMARDRAQFQGVIDDHRRQRVDAAWARSASNGLRGDLGSLASAGKFQVIDLDCRTSSCLATLEWPSFAEARRAQASLIAHRYHPNCAYGVSMPEPDEPGGPYRASMIFQCAEAGDGSE